MNTNIFIAKTLWRRGSGKRGLGRGSSLIATVSVAVSVMVMVLAISISDGFKKEIKEKASGFSGEILLHTPGVEYTTNQYPLNSKPESLSSLKDVPQILSMQPYAFRSGIIKRGNEIQGVLIKGVDKDYNWDFFKSVLYEGRVPDTSDTLATGEIMISLRLANMLNFKVGDNIIIYFIDQGVKVRKFLLSGIYNAQLEDMDKSLVIGSLSQIQRVNDWDTNEVSGIEIKLRSGADIDKTALLIENRLNDSDSEDPVYVTKVNDIFPHLFDWLTLLDFNVLVVMILMLSVAGFNMISGLLILLFEKISMIGLLKSLGMRDSGIHKIFLTRALYMVISGMVAGNIIAITLALIQKHYGVISLDPVNYFVDRVPIDINWFKILIMNIGALSVIIMLLMIPSLFISRVSPDKTLRVK
ncbi:MAG: ABC transporter permease [Bacteroidales bacterium]